MGSSHYHGEGGAEYRADTGLQRGKA